MKINISAPAKTALSLALVIMTSSAMAQSFTSTYDFASVTTSSGLTDPTAPPVAAGVTFGSFSAVGYVGSPNAASRFSFTTNGLGSSNGINDFSTFTGSLDPAKYFEVTLTPQAGFTLDLDSIAFTIQRSGTGIRSYAVRSSLDGFAANLSASISPANVNLGVGANNDFQYLFDANSNAQNGSLVTLGGLYDSLSAPVTFRFYGWNAEAVTGTFSIDNVAFSGSAVVVPEPSSMAIVGGFGVLGLFMAARRRK